MSHRWPVLISFTCCSAFAQPATKTVPEESDINQKRFEWFYNQRARPHATYPNSVRLNALKHMESMARPQPAKISVNGMLSSTQWTSIGPKPIGSLPDQYSGQVNAIAINPSNTNIVYIGTNSGGVWKTTDGGVNWAPLTDAQPSLSVTSIALTPSDPDIIFAATGMAFNYNSYIQGAGILKSTDGGNAWTQISGPFVQPDGSITTVNSLAVQPGGSQVVLAVANEVGSVSPKSVFYRSGDGGTTWSQVLSFPAGHSGQVLFDPTNANHVFAAASAAGVYQSFDAGQTWAPTNGTGANVLPVLQGALLLTVAVAPSSPKVLYVATKLPGQNWVAALYKSVDSGANWTAIGVPTDESFGSPWSLAVHPSNPDIVYAGSVYLHLSLDGGATWTNVSEINDLGHYLPYFERAQAFTPDGSRFYIGNEDGVWSTTSPTNPAYNWTNLNGTLTLAMFYPGFSISPSDANTAFAGAHDNGTLRYGGSLAWQNDLYYQCQNHDGGWTAIDFLQPQNVYIACAAGIWIEKSVNYGNVNSFQPANTGIDTQQNSAFLPPLVMDPSNPQTLYFGTEYVYQTVNGAQSWSAISPQLGGPPGSTQCCLTTIAVAPSDPNTVYTGSERGAIYVSRNALSGASAIWGYKASSSFTNWITQIAVHPKDPLTAYVTFSGYGLPHVWTTSNGGATWLSASGNLPDIPVNDILIDPDQTTTLYVATDIGVFRSQDSGATWAPLGAGLPHVIVNSIKLHRRSRILRAATYGRGAWDLYVPLAGQVTITIASAPAGAQFQIEDGSTYYAPASFSWNTGSQHTITWLGALLGRQDMRYAFQSWADGGSNPRTITVPLSSTTYTANMTIQYALTLTVWGSGAVTTSPASADGFFNQGTLVTLTAVPAPGSVFGGFSPGWSSPFQFIMNEPVSMVANFISCGYGFKMLPPSLLGPGPTSTALIWTTSPLDNLAAQCTGSASSNAGWLTAGSSSPVDTQTNVIPYSLAENTGAARSATLTFSGANGYSTAISVAQAGAGSNLPSVASFSPVYGSGPGGVFSLQVYDPNGYASIIEATIWIGSCTVAVRGASPGNIWLGYINLLGPLAVPSYNVILGDFCTLDGSLSSVTGAGNILTVKVGLAGSGGLSANPVAVTAIDINEYGKGAEYLDRESVGIWNPTPGPWLSVAKTHSGNFAQGQQNATYSVTVQNPLACPTCNPVPTSGTVIVAETLPPSLSLVSMAGTGWTCPGGAPNVCTRSDALKSGGSYPPITVTVNVAPNATSPQVNTVTVWGGGSMAAKATDSTVITPNPPVLSITKTHNGTFKQGQQNATYQVTASNTAGSGAVSGTVTVTDTLPSGLTLVSMAGTGWACPGTAPNNCTRSDPLNGGASYPPIIVTVNVAANAASPQVNSVAVSGGGSATASATDSTVITANPPLLSITKAHSGSFTQGQQNATYQVTVSNAALAGPTIGTVQVTDSVPSGLTLISMGGTGWTCPGTAPNNCTRSDILNGGASYPPITVTVNVTSNATSPQVNSAAVSGGGAPNAGTTDSTAITSAPPPSVAHMRDFMGNGRSDVLTYDPRTGTAYTALSNGDGTYKYVYNLFTSAFDTLRTGDFNGDHMADLILYNSKNTLAYIGVSNGDGTFAFHSLFWSPGYDIVEIGDIDGDGKSDVALYNSSTGTVYTGISNGAGAFTYKYHLISPGYTLFRLADFTGDGKADLLLYNPATGQANLGIGDGAGGFAFHSLFVSPGYLLADIGDLDGDGKADIILYNPANGNAATGISDGAGGFAFTPLLFSPGFTSVRLADYTGDGKADVTVYNKLNAAAYFGAGTGAGTFNFQSLFWSPAYDVVEPQDVDGNGKSDIVLYNSTTGTEYTGISNGAGGFTYTYSLWGSGKVVAK